MYIYYAPFQISLLPAENSETSDLCLGWTLTVYKVVLNCWLWSGMALPPPLSPSVYCLSLMVFRSGPSSPWAQSYNALFGSPPPLPARAELQIKDSGFQALRLYPNIPKLLPMTFWYLSVMKSAIRNSFSMKCQPKAALRVWSSAPEWCGLYEHMLSESA